MRTCPTCKRETPVRFAFCGNCGAALPPTERPRDLRKTVTVLFCDTVGSTAMGERTDPEALRRTMGNYFDAARAILERHGGTVEKFIGDAVMAIFGLPVAHEDDALRAVRAADELRAAQPQLRLELRIGVNTGEVVAGEGETLVTGDAVNVAARLEQAARPGEVLIGAETSRLVRDAAELEPVEPLEVKGKSAPLRAYRLTAVRDTVEGFARRLDAPLVGRRRELQRLRDDFDRAVAERTCQLFTLLGPAGVGKSRLVAELLAEVGEDARVVRGRCLHYGDGITYWPLVEALKQLGAEPEAVIGTTPAETQLSFRRLLEREAARRPLVVVFDDLQWAEPIFLDLIEHVADLSRGAPILLLCVARPDLLEERPAWGGGKLNAATVLLEPLPEDETAELIERLVHGAPLDDTARRRILAAAQGNPLFVEEMVAMSAENGDAELVVPPTIHALLQARLDRLRAEERAVIERGAVEGQVFHRGAVVELAAGTDVDAQLPALVRKELIRPDVSTAPDDDAYRFRHLLIRDAAYDALPKETRADLHARFADWIAVHRSLVEQDEIVGYHLEQAARYRAELGEPDPELASRAYERLAAAGEAALERGDTPAARTLLDRAVELVSVGDPRRLELLFELGSLRHFAGDFERAREAIEELSASGDARFEAYGALAEQHFLRTLGRTTPERARAVARRAIAVFTAVGDERGLSAAWQVEHVLAWNSCRATDAARATERALEHARKAGVARDIRHLEQTWLAAQSSGPAPLAETRDALEERVERLERQARPEGDRLRMALSFVRAMEGRFDEARRLVRAAISGASESGQTVSAASRAQGFWFVERFGGDFEAAERALHEAFERLGRLDERSFRSTVAVNLADIRYELGRMADAEEACAAAVRLNAPGDVVNECGVAAVRAKLLAHHGRDDEARPLAARAWQVAGGTDFYSVRTHALEALAEVCLRAGDRDAARAAAARAEAEWQAKGALVRPIPLQRLLAEL